MVISIDACPRSFWTSASGAPRITKVRGKGVPKHMPAQTAQPCHEGHLSLVGCVLDSPRRSSTAMPTDADIMSALANRETDLKALSQNLFDRDTERFAANMAGLIAKLAADLPLLGPLVNQATTQVLVNSSNAALRREYEALAQENDRQQFVEQIAGSVAPLIDDVLTQLVRGQHRATDELVRELNRLRADLKELRPDFPARLAQRLSNEILDRVVDTVSRQKPSPFSPPRHAAPTCRPPAPDPTPVHSLAPPLIRGIPKFKPAGSAAGYKRFMSSHAFGNAWMYIDSNNDLWTKEAGIIQRNGVAVLQDDTSDIAPIISEDKNGALYFRTLRAIHIHEPDKPLFSAPLPPTSLTSKQYRPPSRANSAPIDQPLVLKTRETIHIFSQEERTWSTPIHIPPTSPHDMWATVDHQHQVLLVTRHNVLLIDDESRITHHGATTHLIKKLISLEHCNRLIALTASRDGACTYLEEVSTTPRVMGLAKGLPSVHIIDAVPNRCNGDLLVLTAAGLACKTGREQNFSRMSRTEARDVWTDGQGRVWVRGHNEIFCWIRS